MTFKGKIVGTLIVAGLLSGVFGAISYEALRDNRKRLIRSLDSGITHQYIDTNANGKYDFYRFIKKGPIIESYVDRNGDGEYDYTTLQDDSEVYSSPLTREIDKEEAQDMYRVGKFEFIEM